jgi:phosphomannomutase/phosphoglucomutase
MHVNSSIFRGYDLRGLVGEDLSPELAEHLGRAFGTYLKRRGITQAIVGRDCRETSPEYSKRLAEGLAWTGVDVQDIGMQLVGTFYWAQHHLQRKGGVYVSASHNPPEYNGFKFANDYSETLVSDGMQEMLRLVQEEDYEQGDKPGAIEVVDIRPAYFADVIQRVPLSRSFKVVVDPSNTTAGDIAPDLLRQAGCEVIEFNTNVDPTFPLGVADPTETAVMRRLQKEVVDSGADVAFTFDADGDRIGIVDEAGNIIWNDVLVGIFATGVLLNHPGATIMYNTLCSKMVEDTIIAHGGKPFMWRVGHSFLKKKNQEVKAAFIGELSGHFFFSQDFYNHDDGLYSMMSVLRHMADTGKKLSEIVDELPKYISSPEIKLSCADDKKVALVDKLSPILRQDYPDADVIDDEGRAGDGVRLEMTDAMFVLRYSQNGPYLTIKFEAKTPEEYEKLRVYIAELLRRFPEVDWKSKIATNVEALEQPATA